MSMIFVLAIAVSAVKQNLSANSKRCREEFEDHMKFQVAAGFPETAPEDYDEEKARYCSVLNTYELASEGRRASKGDSDDPRLSPMLAWSPEKYAKYFHFETLAQFFKEKNESRKQLRGSTSSAGPEDLDP